MLLGIGLNHTYEQAIRLCKGVSLHSPLSHALFHCLAHQLTASRAVSLPDAVTPIYHHICWCKGETDLELDQWLDLAAAAGEQELLLTDY